MSSNTILLSDTNECKQFIKSKSYRVTVIDKRIVQTATKDANGWKSTGVYQKIHHKFKIDPALKRIVNRIIRATRIHVCGIDFLKRDGKWLVIEANATPSFDFFPRFGWGCGLTRLGRAYELNSVK